MGNQVGVSEPPWQDPNWAPTATGNSQLKHKRTAQHNRKWDLYVVLAPVFAEGEQATELVVYPN